MAIQISKLYNRFTLLSPELADDSNQKLVVDTEGSASFNEDSMFDIKIGPQSNFEKGSESIMLTNDEAKELWLFLSRFYRS